MLHRAPFGSMDFFCAVFISMLTSHNGSRRISPKLFELLYQKPLNEPI
jgi:hypothetical protein